ncbi:MAG: nucleotidyltransferase domain-containing protein [Chlorobi bacterium]|nr:nucleotidyltransferase domain-containing protein [Chlorobiota bacterium]
MKKQTDKILLRCGELAEKHLGKAKVILYGSRARGMEKEYSDWDILILTEKRNTKPEIAAFLKELYNVELELEEVITPIIKNEAEWNSDKYRVTSLYKNVMNDGIQYAK